ncbi:MAG: hypothetical protein B6I20_06335 [Bacteroidetes bacterium 4572_117]|nr:MAG: hypothetical protein B6I20_06335 [Bacteroidetes bacterium 4572_117]
MNKNILLSTVVTLMLVSAFFFGCKKTSDAGIGLIPDSELIVSGASDTIGIEAYTHRVDSIITSNASSVLLGCYTDPVFGSVQAGFVMQITPATTVGFGAGAVADSMVLYLRYATDSLVPMYGNQLTPMDFVAQEVGAELFADSTYYNTYKPEWLNLGPELANTTFIPEDGRRDTVTLDVHFNKEFADRLVADYDYWHDDVEPIDTFFHDYLGGIYIKSNDIPHDGSLNTFSILDAYSRAVLYYHNDDGDTSELTFNISQYSARFNLFNHEHNAPGFLPDLENPEVKQDSVVYLQGIGGLKVKIKIPGLDELKKTGLWGVNRAELIIPVEEDLLTDETTYPAPLVTKILGITDEGGLDFLDDYLNDGVYSGVEYKDNKYVFDITYRVQQILSGSVENNGFFLFPASDYVNPSRVVLTGPNHTNGMKLILGLRKLE